MTTLLHTLRFVDDAVIIFGQFAPRPPLVFPAEHGRNRTQPLFVDFGLALRGRPVE